MTEKTLSPDCGLRILNSKWLSDVPMKEKRLNLDPSLRQSLGVCSPAENHGKKGLINATVDKSLVQMLCTLCQNIEEFPYHIN